MLSFQKFMGDKRGAAAMLVAILIIPLMAVVGLAIDFTRLTSQRGHVQAALDAAALAGAKTMQTEGLSNKVDAAVNQVFAANMDGAFDDLNCGALSVDKQLSNGALNVQVACDIPATLSAVVGHDGFNFLERSSVAFGVNKLEVALMFDVSGSMGGKKIKALKDAASGALDVLLDLPAAAEGDVRIAMNTYATALNAGDYFEKVTGAKQKRKITYQLTTQKKPKTKNVNNTCVGEREGGHGFKETAPGPGKYLISDVPSCPKSSVLPLTDKRKDLDDFLKTLKTGGRTAGHLGVGWSWYLVSPEWASVWPAASKPQPYDTEDLVKVVILMTDGMFNEYYSKKQGNSSQQAISMCDAMKKKDVLVFSVAFSAPASAEKTLKACATDDDYFFDANNAEELEQAYQTIAVRISDLRVAG